MDLNFEPVLSNTTLLETELLENIFINKSALLPEATDVIDVSLFHIVEKIKTIGISELFKKLSANSRNIVIAYMVFFVIGAPGNLYVVITVGWQLWKRRFKRSSRIRLLIWHLALADLLVTFIVIPVEIFWRLTIKWYGGNVLCKSIQFVKAFGLYLSSMVIICISMDRFCAIVLPLKSLGGMKRIHTMLVTAWTFSILFASPQIVVFSVQKHPLYPSFRFCTNSNYFPTFNMKIYYNLLSLVVMYFAPLIVIIVTYTLVFRSISKKGNEERYQNSKQQNSSNQMRQSGNACQITRAKNKAMWISIVIVTVFVVCWTPFVIMSLWYMLDYETAARLVDPRIREALFVTAVSNSCFNPIIYGNYLRRFFRCIFLCGFPQASGNASITNASSVFPGTFNYHNENNSINGGPPSKRVTANDHNISERIQMRLLNNNSAE